MFSEKLKNLRTIDGLSQKRLAQEIELSQSTIAAWENGTRMPTIETVGKVARYFNVSTDYLLSEQNLPPIDRLTADEKQILAVYRSLPRTEKVKATEFLQYLSNK
jgi:transcriptional regulator with XRE-family HTH domain